MSPTLEQVKSFATLEQQQVVAAAELIASLQEYAKSGAAISGRVVNSIVDRTALSDQDLVALHDAALAGVNNPRRKTDSPKETEQYASVVRNVEAHLGRRYLDRVKNEGDPGFGDMGLASR